MLEKHVQINDSSSFSNQLRRERFRLFKKLINHLPRPIHILDIGGTENFWQKMGVCGDSDLQITLLNIKTKPVHSKNLVNLKGDAANLEKFQDQEFDVVFSNSTIEHLFTFANQRKMAQGVQRIGKNFFIQTPNKHFPLEPHFLFPFFQFFPLGLKVWLVRHFNLGWRHKEANDQKARQSVSEIRLLTKKELRQLFPQALIWEEKFLGLTKSFIVYSDFHQTDQADINLH